MKKGIFLALLVVMSVSEVTNGQSDSKGPKTAVKKSRFQSRTNCETFYGTGNASKVYVITIVSSACPGARLFEIEWSGNGPPRILKYRTSGAYLLRDVIRQDTTGIIVSDAPASLGIGASATVTTQVRHNQGQDALYLMN